MGTLAEQLAGFAPEPEETDNTETVVRILLSELDPETDPNTLVPSLRLDSVGLTGLGLWSFVAALERELNKVFLDSDVESWQTLADVIEAA